MHAETLKLSLLTWHVI